MYMWSNESIESMDSNRAAPLLPQPSYVGLLGRRMHCMRPQRRVSFQSASIMEARDPSPCASDRGEKWPVRPPGAYGVFCGRAPRPSL
eukprot:9355573-Heterocapsa_arctica.AAC.1